MSDPEVRSMSKLKGYKSRCFRRKHCLYRQVIIRKMSECIYRYQALYSDAWIIHDRIKQYLPQNKLMEQRNCLGLWLNTYEENFKSPRAWESFIEPNHLSTLESHQYVVKNEYDDETVQIIDEVEYWWCQRVKEDSQHLAYELRSFTAIFRDRGIIPFLQELDRVLSKIIKGLGGSTLSSPDNAAG